jgi:small subunit ribosomal protein S11
MADVKPATTAPAAKEAPAKKSVADILADAPVTLPTVPETDGKKKVKKTKRNVPKARACIYAGENNTIVTITDLDGKALAWASAGSSGFKGARKSTPYAAKVAAERAMTMCIPFGVQNLTIEVRGIGPGREQAIRGLQLAGITFDQIKDTTAIAHGGCRPPKPRRV